MKVLLATLGMLSFFLSNAQKPSDRLVITTIIDKLVKVYNFSFYTENLLHAETQEFGLHAFDTFTIFNIETYEDVVRSGIDNKIYFDSINLSESKLFKQRGYFPDGLYLVYKIKPNQVHKDIILSEYIDLPSYPNIQKVNHLPNSIWAKDKLGGYTIRRGTKENISKYKYAMKAKLIFSGVTWDKTGRYCILECGFHYNIPDNQPDRGPSGGTYQVILENKNGIPSIIKFICIGEE